jgi:hypothetical protein
MPRSKIKVRRKRHRWAMKARRRKETKKLAARAKPASS